jgi:hypothetical protein
VAIVGTVVEVLNNQDRWLGKRLQAVDLAEVSGYGFAPIPPYNSSPPLEVGGEPG